MTETIEQNATQQHDTSSVSAKPRLLDRVVAAIRVMVGGTGLEPVTPAM